MLGYTPPGLGMSPTQNGVGDYSQQSLGQLMPWGANPYGALHNGLQQISQASQQPMAPMWGGGMPQQNLAMFGQAAQQPMGGMPNNYFAAILQALQGNGGMQQAPQQQVPNPMNWQLQSAVPQGQPSFISSLGQITPPAPAAAPAAAGTTPEQQALMNWLYYNAQVPGGGAGDAGGGNGGGDTGGASAESGGGSP